MKSQEHETIEGNGLVNVLMSPTELLEDHCKRVQSCQAETLKCQQFFLHAHSNLSNNQSLVSQISIKRTMKSSANI